MIASINGVTPGGWIRYAELLQEAGADAIELNVYAVETDPYASAASVEDRTLRLVSSVHGALSVPLAVKVGPYYTAFANTAMRLADAGAAGASIEDWSGDPSTGSTTDRMPSSVSPQQLTQPEGYRILS